MANTLEMIPKRTLSFGEFVRLSDQQRKALGRVTILPARLGSPGFGCVVSEKPIFAHKALRGKKRTKR